MNITQVWQVPLDAGPDLRETLERKAIRPGDYILAVRDARGSDSLRVVRYLHGAGGGTEGLLRRLDELTAVPIDEARSTLGL